MTVYRRPDPIPLPRNATAPAVAPRPLGAVRTEVEDLHQLVARRIFAAIVAGDFPEGSILPNEHDLSRDLGVSRTALREAIKGLASKGMVETRRRRGTMVMPRRRWNMLDAEVMRWSRRIEPTALVSARLWQVLAATQPSLAGLAAARGGSAGFRRAAQRLEAEGKIRPETLAAFHLEIAEAGGNPFLASLTAGCLDDLLAEDPGFLARLAADSTIDTYRLVGQQVALHDMAAAEQAMHRLMERSRSMAPA